MKGDKDMKVKWNSVLNLVIFLISTPAVLWTTYIMVTTTKTFGYMWFALYCFMMLASLKSVDNLINEFKNVKE